MQDLVIVGASWGCGAYSTPDKIMAHNSTTRDNGIVTGGDDYMSECIGEYFKVDNRSQGGTCNFVSVAMLKDFLDNKTGPDSQCLFIQTDPVKDMLISMQDFFSLKKMTEICDAVKFFSGMLELTYMQLDTLGKTHNIIINITGADSDVMPSATSYDNLNVVCDSFYKMIDSDYEISLFGSSYEFDLNNYFGPEPSFEYILNSQHNKLEIEKKNKSTDIMGYFGYGSDNHPSRKGIDMWVDYMVPRMQCTTVANR